LITRTTKIYVRQKRAILLENGKVCGGDGVYNRLVSKEMEIRRNDWARRPSKIEIPAGDLEKEDSYGD